MAATQSSRWQRSPLAVELRLECVLGVPQSDRTALGDALVPRGGRHGGRKPLPVRSRGRYSKPETGMGSVHMGNVGSKLIVPTVTAVFSGVGVLLFTSDWETTARSKGCVPTAEWQAIPGDTIGCRKTSAPHCPFPRL